MRTKSGNRWKKSLVLLAALAVLILFFGIFGKFETVDEFYLTHMEDITADTEVVRISINCKTILYNWSRLDKQLRDEKYVPANGVILPETAYVYRKGDTAFDLLERVCRYNRIEMEYRGATETGYGSAYIRGINYLNERSCGELSGWMFKVNGEFPGVGCSSVVLQPGDTVEWIYTCDLGRDVGNTYNGAGADYGK
ncbi:MAG: DUF4430 domain-containing protein [Eubacteriales bacterium]|nr:DUF4430 domain-containing protein [Eubacteriales bacterium]